MFTIGPNYKMFNKMFENIYTCTATSKYCLVK